MTKGETRGKAGNNQLGTLRYQRYVAAFDHVMYCLKRGYHLEAIAVIDSLIGDRLASRLGHLLKEEIPVELSVGQLCRKLLESGPRDSLPAEMDSAFQPVIKDIRAWVKQRHLLGC